MTAPAIRTWQAVQEEVRRRIAQRVWLPGAFIPHEADLAREFGCARATVNRALQGLADEGVLDRRRKAGTRVAANPVRKARLEIPIIRREIEAKGSACRHVVLSRALREAPPDVLARMRAPADARLLHLRTLYAADGAPYVLEDRWIDPAVVPAAAGESFEEVSPNEWLVREVPLEGGDFTFSATSATSAEASALGCAEGAGLFVLERTTWNGSGVVTSVRLVFHPGYRMYAEI